MTSDKELTDEYVKPEITYDSVMEADIDPVIESSHSAQLTPDQVTRLVEEYRKRGFTVETREVDGKVEIFVDQTNANPLASIDEEALKQKLKIMILNGGAEPAPYRSKKTLDIKAAKKAAILKEQSLIRFRGSLKERRKKLNAKIRSKAESKRRTK